MRRSSIAIAASLLIVAHAAAAQQPSGIPLRQVRTVASTDSGVIRNVYVLHVRADGRVLVNDATRLRLLLLDTSLKSFTIVADTAGESRHPFGAGPGGLLLFPSDSTAFVDATSQALVIVGPDGQIGRITTPPKAADFRYFSGNAYGVPGFDVEGRLYYRAARAPAGLRAVTSDTIIMQPDSAPVIRADFNARRLDTVAMLRVPFLRQRYQLQENGAFQVTQFLNPVPSTDDWAYYPDGTIAVIRGADYHIDWFLPDGTRKSSPRLPFDWRRITDADKTRIADSTQHILDSTATANFARATQAAAAQGRPAPQRTSGAISASVDAHELPDYYPAVRASSQPRVDREGNLWIIPSTAIGSAGGGTIFDVVNRDGVIVERVQLPAGRNLHGFGPRGTVYMSVPVSHSWPRVERGEFSR